MPLPIIILSLIHKLLNHALRTMFENNLTGTDLSTEKNLVAYLTKNQRKYC